MTNIGDRIKKSRKDAGLSQSDFAASIGVTQGFLSGLEKGRYQPTADTLICIANIYQVDAAWLLTGKESESKKPADRETRIINRMLEGMTDEQKADVRKYAEEKKLLAECLKERANRKTG